MATNTQLLAGCMGSVHSNAQSFADAQSDDAAGPHLNIIISWCNFCLTVCHSVSMLARGLGLAAGQCTCLQMPQHSSTRSMVRLSKRGPCSSAACSKYTSGVQTPHARCSHAPCFRSAPAARASLMRITLEIPALAAPKSTKARLTGRDLDLFLRCRLVVLCSEQCGRGLACQSSHSK